MTALKEPPATERDYVRDLGVETFEAFFRREYRSMVALAAAVSGDPATAEDLAQEAMVRARDHWEDVRAFDKPGTWVRRVTINLALSTRRRLATEAKARLAWFERHGTAPADAPAIDHDLVGALRALSPQQRAAVSLHYLEDRSTAEIAELLGCAEATARVHLHRGRQALAKSLGGSTR